MTCMKVQTKIILLLGLIVATFVAGIIAAKFSAKAKFDRIARARAEERTKSFDEFLRRRSEPLEMLAKDYSCWDDLVRALSTHDEKWAAENLNDSPLVSFGANAIWVYHRDLSPFFSHNNLYAEKLAEMPMPRSELPALFSENRTCHFFLNTPLGLMEIRGATIHPSEDSQRKTEPRGYFFAGKLWSNESVHEMGIFTNNDVELRLGDQPRSQPSPQQKQLNLESNSSSAGVLVFTRALNGFDGRPVAELVVTYTSPAVAELNRFMNSLIIGVIVFALVALVLLTLALTRWVSQPLRSISETLNTDNTALLLKLRNDSSEFGKISQLIRHFFEQRAILMKEIKDRQAAEQALTESEEQLRQSAKMEAVGRLAGGVAHDFNNLLTAIIGYANLLGERITSDRLARTATDSIRKAGEQAAALTRQLLAFSRKQILQPRVIDLNAVVREMETLLLRVIGEHIDLRTITDATDARVRADRGQLEQVIMNLAVNARDAMPNGGVLTIRTANVFLDEESTRVHAGMKPGEYVLIAVTDTGEGMDKETQQRIFEPFFTTKAPGKGTGLGLATVYGIIRQSGGGISVESAPQRGTSFRIYLPLERAPLDAPKTHHGGPIEQAIEAETVLVVEDEEIVRKLLCSVLEHQGYKVLCAERGSEAFDLCEGHRGPIHLLITDVIMPEQSGPELARRVIAQRPEIAVLYISGYSDVELGAALETEIEILPKPFTPQQLARRVREILGHEKSSTPDYAMADRA